ncbi:sigma-70 family RNA polymerase sigma factor [Lapillicoccus sp.]|uniref:RNA polymerase sigma factor n=1 Tax=Lapillicoccus sp. TaxID=1909287 RepID=UPI0025F69BF0|nr:sigma-70 family RNA polymerase sigma factor [Lapillicoccus sp.]
MSTSTSAERRFQDVFDSCASLVHAYALRHTDPESAQDVVSDVFLVAWRRMDQLPAEPLAWLLVVARNTLANSRRSATRRGQLERRLAAAAGHGTTATAQPAEELAVDRASMLAALAELTDAEREAILLIAWDGLTAADAARVAGCSRNAFDARLHRARDRLERLSRHRHSGDAIPSLRLTREARA